MRHGINDHRAIAACAAHLGLTLSGGGFHTVEAARVRHGLGRAPYSSVDDRVGCVLSAQFTGPSSAGGVFAVVETGALGVIAALQPDAEDGEGGEADDEDDDHDDPAVVGGDPACRFQ